jgi:3-hydroxybutyryl-CoA dehydrogenase
VKAHEPAVAIVGGGIMGSGIATVFAVNGWAVHVMSPSAATRARLPARIAAGGAKLGASAATASRLHVHARLEDVAWPDVDLVIEAATEDLALKQRLFAQLEALTPADIPFATNTSALPIGAIGGALKTRARVAGLHFFMPAHLVPLVEVVCAEFTDGAVADRLERLMKGLGKMPIRVNRDIPGFVGNRLQHALMREALSLVAAGVASPEAVDIAVRYGFGFRFIACGPMLQKEMSGWDTNMQAAASVYPSLSNDPAPAPMFMDMVARGAVGMKAGHGLWTWTDTSIARERARYEKALQAGLEILRAELPPAAADTAAGSPSPSESG